MSVSTQITHETNWFGPHFVDQGWAPAPRYLLRRARILHHMNAMPSGRLVEIGCASGALLSELADKRFECVGLETSHAALCLAKRVNAETGVTFQTEPDSQWRGTFDYCLSFEVLEHIEHDLSALQEWVGWLKPGGKMLLSVPAHPGLWNASDIWAGHFRRYSRARLRKLFSEAGMKVERIECYGFPLANALELALAKHYQQTTQAEAEKNEAGRTAQTAQSGIERAAHVKAFPYYSRGPGALIMRCMIFVQSLFLRVGLGNGFLVIATKE